MPRIRTIQPHFPRSTSMVHVSRDARLLFIQLWTVADDCGRARAALPELAATLYPADADAPALLPDWLDELEREGCIERYTVEDVDYLRVASWRKHQRIDRPTPSRLPPAPREPLASPREESPPVAAASASEAIPREPLKISKDWVLREVEGILRDSRSEGELRPALRAVELLGRSIGMWDHRQAERIAEDELTAAILTVYDQEKEAEADVSCACAGTP
ncbi:MAG: hypothetical protein JSR47_04075 [Proteobacteria bacterium]|nr:hypothetical protein [Pseudomonadota bacterium]